MRIPEAKVQEILNKANILDVVGDYVQLTLKGDRYWGLSPFKPEKTPSFTVSPDKGVYYCFSTQEGGNAVNFVMKVENMTFPEALTKLAQKFGISLTETDEGLDQDFKDKQALQELYQRLSHSFHHLLTETKEGSTALQYLRNRGISDQSIGDFELGYTPKDPDWLYAFLQKKGYSPDLLKKSGLFSKNHPRWPLFSNRLMFPIKNISGNTLAFGGRLLEGEGPKYINSPETLIYHKGSNVYGIGQAKDGIKKNDTAILCEGYMDVIALHQGGLGYAIAPLGTSFTEEQAKLLKRLCSQLCLLFDSDSAGITATLRSMAIAEKFEFDTFIISLENAKDPADILERDGSQSITKLVDYKINAFDYLLRRATKDVNVQSPSGKEHVIKEFTSFIKSIPSNTKRDSSMALLASYLSLDVDKLESEYKRRGISTEEKTILPKPIPKKVTKLLRDSRSEIEVKLMTAVFIHMEYFGLVRMSAPIETFRNPWAKDLYLALEESFRRDEFNIDVRMQRLEFEDLRAHINKKMVENEYTLETERFIRDGLKRLQILVLESRRSDIELKLERLNAQANYDVSTLTELIEEKMIIDKTLRDLRGND